MPRKLETLAIVVVGAGWGSRLQEGIPVEKRKPKAYYPVAGEPMVSYILKEALKIAPDAVFFVHPPGWGDKLEGFPEVRMVSGGNGPLGDPFTGIKAAEEFDQVIVVNGDALLVTAEPLLELQSALRPEVGFVLPAINPEVCFPDESVKYIPGSMNRRPNVFAVRPGALCWSEQLQKLLEMKNNGLSKLIGEARVLISILGGWRAVLGIRPLMPPELKFLLDLLAWHPTPFPKYTKGVIGRRYVGYHLPTYKLEKYMSAFLGCKVEIPLMSVAAFAFDIDYAVDVPVALAELRKQGRL
jgi:molybdopterin-guanine dinucleotide biosynthesis protein A